ncbi:unnamed protein product [Adineta ricciae]|uniref:G-protein coupled receptors family 1 profile domain-containing protein n=2 Tax=Adineta ricciae TaxID=249248 RepID=A0A815FBY9_ADIRI|nr:unnamed protein product [Adineta ricciae]
MTSNSGEFQEVISDEVFRSLTQSSTVLFNITISTFQSNISLTTSPIDTPYDHYQTLTDTIIYKYICLTIFIIGVIGNFLSVLVFSRPSLRHRSCAVYFLALAITDIASLIASFIDTVLPSYSHFNLTAKSLFICKLNPLMVYFTTDLSNFLLAVASIDRAVSIQCPLKSKRFCRARIAIYIIFLMSVIFLFINGHIFWGFEIIPATPTHFGCVPSNRKIVFENEVYSITYERFYQIFDSLDMLFAVVIPFVVMLICNIIILIRVLTSRRSIRTIMTTALHSKKHRKRHEKEKQLTVMLLGSAAAFLVFTLPTEINDTIRVFTPSNTSHNKGVIALITAIFIAMGQLNHAIHFYIYTLTGGVFRNELIQLFSLSKPKRFVNRRSNTEQTLLQSKHVIHKNTIPQLEVHAF